MPAIKTVKPFHIGLGGHRNLQTINYQRVCDKNCFDISAGNVVFFKLPISAVFISLKPIVVSEKSNLSGMTVRSCTFNYGCSETHMLMCIVTDSKCDAMVDVMNLDALPSAKISGSTSIGDAVARFVDSTNKKEIIQKVPPVCELFPYASETPKQQGFVIGYISEQHLEEAIAGKDLWETFAPIFLFGHDSWGGEVDNVGQLLMHCMNFCSCGGLLFGAADALQEVLLNYSVKNHYDRVNGKVLVEKYGHVGVDYSFAVLDKLELIEHGSCVPGWLNDSGVFLREIYLDHVARKEKASEEVLAKD